MIVTFVGRMGAGKTSLSVVLAAMWPTEYERLSVGEINRALPPVGLTEAGLDPREPLIRTLLYHEIERIRGLGRTVLLDGFPRNRSQLDWLLDQVGLDLPVWVRNRHWLQNLSVRGRGRLDREVRTMHKQRLGLLALARASKHLDSIRPGVFSWFPYDNGPLRKRALDLRRIIGEAPCDEQRSSPGSHRPGSRSAGPAARSSRPGSRS